jgi:hypothetical protein
MELARPRTRIDPRTRPPRPWAAALLTLVTPGLGHAYAGEWTRATAVWAGGLALALLLLGPVHADGADDALFAGLSGLLYLAWGMLDAARHAQRYPRTRLRRFNRWFVYLALALAAGGGALVLVAGLAA